MKTDKKTVARRLIHNAIRQTIYREDPIALHLASMACYDLLRKYAEVKGIELTANTINRVPQQLLKQVVEAIKLTYLFSKHARGDADNTIDETTIVPFADLMLLTVIGMYVGCFSETTEHMKAFRQCHGNSDSSAVRRRLASSDETDIV